MAARRLPTQDWAAIPQTRIQTKRSKEPRDEQCRLPKSVQRPRPKPINLALGDQSPLAKTLPTLPVSPISPTELDVLCESPLEPEIVDVAAPNTWPRGTNSRGRLCSGRPTSPSIMSQYSSRVSYIPSYYGRGPSLDYAPPTPRLDTPIIDPGLEKFDFELPQNNLSPRFTSGRNFYNVPLDAKPGAEAIDRSANDMAPQHSQPPAASKTAYRLFPTIKDTSPPNAFAGQSDPGSPQYHTLSSNSTSTPSHHQPETSYRPRRESLSSSVRSRKDSFTSFSGTKRIQMRVLLEGSKNEPKKSTALSSPFGGSPPEGSRWSDDTIISPLVATTPGLRTSFGSLLGRNFDQDPVSYFDSDDESVPLRRKLRWKRSTSLTEGHRAQRDALMGGRRSVSARLKSIILCAGCCGDVS